MDLGTCFAVNFDWNFFTCLFSIIIIDLVLAADNAVVIAMAVRSLSKKKRSRAILLGAGAAVVLRVIFTFFVAQMLQINFIKLGGGVLILWMAVKLFIEGSPDESPNRTATTMGHAIKTIVIADFSMSLDNMLAVGGASHGSLFLLIFGLGLSIPFVVFASNLLSRLMDKYPIIVYFGAAILGKVGGEMIISDPFTVNLLAPDRTIRYAVEAFFALGVIAAGKLWVRRSVETQAAINS